MIKIKTINNNFLKNLEIGKKYYIFNENTLCYGKYIKNYIENENENRFIFQDVIYIKTNFSTNILSTTIIDKIILLDLGLPKYLQNEIEKFY